MSANQLLIWNVRGLNCRARRSAVRSLVEQHRASIVCLQESKIVNFSAPLNYDITGIDFDYVFLPAIGVAGGAAVAWRQDLWAGSHVSIRQFSITLSFTPLNGQGDPWWLTNVYGPTDDGDKAAFLQELREIRAACTGAWFVCGDFNMIYMGADKNTSRLHRGIMRRF